MIVVTGASGNVGRELVRVLAAEGEQVRAVSRRPMDAAWQADLAEPESMRPVLDGADALFLLLGGDRPADLMDVAKAGGVRRVVLVTSLAAGTRPQLYRQSLAFEQAVAESGLGWTVLRPGAIDSNAFAWAESIRARRTAVAPFGDVGLPTVDPADIAEVAAVALREEGHDGRIHELTGPAPTTPRERAATIGEALGEPVAFVEQSAADARAEMLRFMPEELVEGTLGILGSPLPAERRVSPDVERVLGRPARSFADWVARTSDAFR
jgi:uncharacterized protein YbjT (DUF2867 family)